MLQHKKKSFVSCIYSSSEMSSKFLLFDSSSFFSIFLSYFQYMIVLFLVFVVQFSVSCACLAINKDQQVGVFHALIFLSELNLPLKSGCEKVSFALSLVT